MIGGNKLIWTIVIILSAIILYFVYTLKSNNYPIVMLGTFIEKQEEIIKQKDTIIQEKQDALIVSEAKYKVIVEKIKAKAAQAEQIKQPVSAKETRERFKNLGYPPIDPK